MEGFHSHVQEELLLAKQSRQEGNEGRARVCARRAAGAAAREFLGNEDLGISKENALNALRRLGEVDSLPIRVQKAIKRLLDRVDEYHNLPPGIDLIQEADIIIQYIESFQQS